MAVTSLLVSRRCKLWSSSSCQRRALSEIVVIPVGCCHASPRRPSLHRCGNFAGNAGEENKLCIFKIHAHGCCPMFAAAAVQSVHLLQATDGDGVSQETPTEKHWLKNKNCKLSRELKRVPVDNNLLLTGAPLQNNLGRSWWANSWQRSWNHMGRS